MIMPKSKERRRRCRSRFFGALLDLRGSSSTLFSDIFLIFFLFFHMFFVICSMVFVIFYMVFVIIYMVFVIFYMVYVVFDATRPLSRRARNDAQNYMAFIWFLSA